jgi:hypothetical protein
VLGQVAGTVPQLPQGTSQHTCYLAEGQVAGTAVRIMDMPLNLMLQMLLEKHTFQVMS